MKQFTLLSVCLLMIPAALFSNKAHAKIDLAALTDRGAVQTTIYQGADLTLVRDQRVMTLVQGMNYLQFSWANTRIDPTSLSMEIERSDTPIDIVEVSYPAGTKALGIWHIKAEKTCRAVIDITYFTSGLSWASFYTVILSRDLETATLINHVDITNRSGEDYADARTRLVVGKINLLDDIRSLAERRHPYGRPRPGIGGQPEPQIMYKKAAKMLEAAPAGRMMSDSTAVPKEIIKQSMSEYFLYSIEGRETIADGWSKRLLSFKADTVTVQNVYRMDKKQFGDRVIRFVKLKNDRTNQLGTTPLPDGRVTVFQTKDTTGELEYIGSDHTKYIPIGGAAEFNLGQTLNVKIEPKIINFRKENISYDKNGNLNGFDDTKKIRVRFSNFTREKAVCEYTLRMETSQFKISQLSDPDALTTQDQKTVVFHQKLDPGETRNIDFTLTTLRGERRWHQ